VFIGVTGLCEASSGLTCAIDVLRLDDNSTTDKDNIIKIVIEKDFIFFLVGLFLFLSILLRTLLLFLFFGLCLNKSSNLNKSNASYYRFS
jgi:hypothetical protein